MAVTTWVETGLSEGKTDAVSVVATVVSQTVAVRILSGECDVVFAEVVSAELVLEVVTASSWTGTRAALSRSGCGWERQERADLDWS